MVVLHRRLRLDPQGAEGWPHAREQAGGERDADRVENQTPVVLRVEQDGPPAHRKESGQALESDVRDDQSRRGAEHEEHERFGQHLPEKSARAGAGGQPKRELARSHRPAYEQEPSEVRARGQQENRSHQRHHIQRTGKTSAQSIQSPRCRCQLDAIKLRPRARGGASAVGPERLDTRVGLRCSLPDLDARSQTCHRIEPLRVGVADHGWVERDGQGDIHLTSRLEAMESWRRDADDRKRAIAECQRAADRAGGAAEPALPVSVTHHGDRGIQSLVAGGHQAPGGRRHSQHLEVVPGGHLSEHLLDGSLHLHSQLVSRERGHSRRRRSLVSDALEVRVGRGAAETSIARGADEDQFLRVHHRQLAQQDRLEEADDRGVGADGDGQRQHDDCREARIAAKRAQRVSKILVQVIDPPTHAECVPHHRRSSRRV